MDRAHTIIASSPTLSAVNPRLNLQWNLTLREMLQNLKPDYRISPRQIE